MTHAGTTSGQPSMIVDTHAAGPSIMTRLRHETAAAHQEAESQPFQRDMLRGVLTPAQVATWFVQMRTVHATLEPALHDAMPSWPTLPAALVSERSRLADIEADLRTLAEDGATLGATPELWESTKAVVSEIDQARAERRHEALLGMFYVLEGSTNGSRYIARALQRAWGWPAERALRAFDPYRELQQERWRAFKQDMDAATFTVAQEDEIVLGAGRMFQGITRMSVAADGRGD